MLAKQGWRLIQFEDSLVARILKAKYYARGDFMSTQLTSNSSFTWRSILKGRVILEKGLIWRVGNGERIHITESPSVLNVLEFKVRLTENTGSENWIGQSAHTS